MIDTYEATLGEMQAVTMRPHPVELSDSCHALVVALVQLEEAVALLAHRPSCGAMRRLNCAWALALRRYRYYVTQLRYQRGPA